MQVSEPHTFEAFRDARRGDYAAVRQLYHGVDWNQRGSSTSTIRCPKGFQLIHPPIERTTDGDWKDGPNYNPDKTEMSWTTGGHGRSETFVKIAAKYTPDGIANGITSELSAVQKTLNGMQIPTELPPLK